jgi:hypothetical protein
MKGTTPRAPTLMGALFLSLVGGSLAVSAGCGGETETRPARWSYISAAIVQPNCATANCHSDLSQRSGVLLNGMKIGWEQLVNRRFVVPGNAPDSALIGLLKGEGSRRMPPDFALPKVDIDLISAWIMAGANYDGPSPAPTATLEAPIE